MKKRNLILTLSSAILLAGCANAKVYIGSMLEEIPANYAEAVYQESLDNMLNLSSYVYDDVFNQDESTIRIQKDEFGVKFSRNASLNLSVYKNTLTIQENNNETRANSKYSLTNSSKQTNIIWLANPLDESILDSKEVFQKHVSTIEGVTETNDIATGLYVDSSETQAYIDIMASKYTKPLVVSDTSLIEQKRFLKTKTNQVAFACKAFSEQRIENPRYPGNSEKELTLFTSKYTVSYFTHYDNFGWVASQVNRETTQFISTDYELEILRKPIEISIRKETAKYSYLKEKRVYTSKLEYVETDELIKEYTPALISYNQDTGTHTRVTSAVFANINSIYKNMDPQFGGYAYYARITLKKNQLYSFSNIRSLGEGEFEKYGYNSITTSDSRIRKSTLADHSLFYVTEDLDIVVTSLVTTTYVQTFDFSIL